MSRSSVGMLFPLGSVFGDKEGDMFGTVFYALMSEDDDDLDEAIELVNRYPELWPDDFSDEMAALRDFRSYYADRMDDYAPEQRDLIEQYDDDWAMDLAARMHGYTLGGVEPDAPEPEVA